ncbi:MAG: HYR domain-containing protein [Acidobacteria bacterium]|nr:HYR domain-containing protein [Acidobacteriota bacterium]
MNQFIPCGLVPRLAVTVVLVLVAARCGGGGPTTPPPPIPTLTIACPTAEPVQSTDNNPRVVTFGTAVATGGVGPLTTTCSAASGAEFPVGTTTVTCTAVDARGVSALCTFPVVVRPPPRLTGTRFLAFGDSITWGVDSPPIPAAAPSFAYPEQLQQRLAARYRLQTPQVINVGEPGEQAQDGGIRRFRSVLLQHRPDIVILMEGTNDLLSLEVGIERGIEALRDMIREAKGQNVRVLLSTIIPQRMNGFRVPNRNPFAVLVPPFNDRVRALAASENVPLVDMFQVFAADMSLLGIDDVHPTVRGFQVMADTFFEAIRANFEQQVAAGVGGLP